MRQPLHFALLLLPAVCVRSISTVSGQSDDLDPNTIKAVDSGASTNTLTLSPPTSPSSPLQHTTTHPPPRPPLPPPPHPPPREAAFLKDGGPLSKGDQFPELVVSSRSIAPSFKGSSTSCSFSVGAVESVEPQTDSFGHPQSVIEQALKDMLAEKALLALQEAKLRTFYISSRGSGNSVDINTNSNDHFGSKNPFLRGINSQNKQSFRTAFRPLNPVTEHSPLVNININSIIDNHPIANTISSNHNKGQLFKDFHGNADSMNFDSNNNNIVNSNNNNNGYIFNPNRFGWQGEQSFDDKMDQTFLNGKVNDRLPNGMFFTPQRVAKGSSSGASKGPIGLYDFQNTDPLNAITVGRGNDVYDVKPRDSTHPDGFDIFQIGSGISLPGRTKRQTRSKGGSVGEACESQPLLLRRYRHYGGVCYVIRPELQHVTFVSCSNAPCSHCQYPGGVTRCLAVSRPVAVWAYCEGAPFSHTVGLDYVHLPVLCSCKTMACS